MYTIFFRSLITLFFIKNGLGILEGFEILPGATFGERMGKGAGVSLGISPCAFLG